MEQESRHACPFCDEEDADIEHVTKCSLRDAQIVSAGNGWDLSKMAGLFSKLCRAKTLCDTFEALPPPQKERMWCCQECFAFGEGDIIPNECPECKSLATSPARMFLEEDRSS